MRIDRRLHPINFSKSNRPDEPKQKTFSDFVSNDFSRPKIPLNVSRAYAIPQINPEYKVLDTFKLPNTEVGKLYQLRNGHRVAIIPKKGPTVIDTYIGAGWTYGKDNKEQTAHLLEHLLSSAKYKNNSKALKNILIDSGAETNAATASYYTHYYTSTPVYDNEELDKLIQLESSRILQPDFTNKDIEKEKNTIFQELSEKFIQKYSFDILEEYSIKKLFNMPADTNSSILYNVFSPDSRSVKNISQDDLMDFYNTNYTPDNMHTVIIGNVDDNTIKTFSKYFSKQLKPVLKTRNSEFEANINNTINTSVQNNVKIENSDNDGSYQSTHTSFLVNTGHTPHEDIINAIVSNILSDKLKKADAGWMKISSISPNKEIWSIRTSSSIEQSENKKEKLLDIIAKMNNVKISEEELKNAKEKVKESILQPQDSTLSLSKYIGENLLKHNDCVDAHSYKLVDSIKLDDINKVIKKNFNFDKTSMSIEVVPPKVNKQEPVSFKGTARLSEIMQPLEYNLPNNVHVLIDEAEEISKTAVQFSLVSKIGNYADKKILEYLDNSVLDSNAKQNADEKKFELFHDVNNNNIRYIIYGNPSKTADIINSGISAIFRPNIFDYKNFENWKKRNIINKNYEPYEISNVKFHKVIYGETPWEARNYDSSKLTLPDIQKFYNDFLANSQLSVLITMPKSTSNLYKTAILQTLSQLPVFKPHNYSEYFNFNKAEPLKENKIILEQNDENRICIEKHYKICKSGNIKDVAGLEIIKTVLGDTEFGLLYNELRTKEQISYTPKVQLVKNTDLPNIYRLSLLTSTTNFSENNNNLKKVLESFDFAAQKLQKDLLNEKSLEIIKRTLKNNIFRSCDETFERNDVLRLCNDSFYGTQFIPELEKAIDSITPHDIRELAKYYLSQPALYMISGNKDAIESNKEYLKTLGEIVE